MAATTSDPSSGAAWWSGPSTKICPGSPIPNSAALPVEVAVPSSSWVKAMMAPPGLFVVTPAMVSLGQLGDPMAAASTATTTKSTTARIGYFQKTWRTRRSGGRSLPWTAESLAADCGMFSSTAMMLVLLLLIGQGLVEPLQPDQDNVRQDQPKDDHRDDGNMDRQVRSEVRRTEEIEEERLDEEHIVGVHGYELRLPVATGQQAEEVLAHGQHEDGEAKPPVENAPTAIGAGGPDAEEMQQREEEEPLRAPVVKRLEKLPNGIGEPPVGTEQGKHDAASSQEDEHEERQPTHGVPVGLGVEGHDLAEHASKGFDIRERL